MGRIAQVRWIMHLGPPGPIQVVKPLSKTFSFSSIFRFLCKFCFKVSSSMASIQPSPKKRKNNNKQSTEINKRNNKKKNQDLADVRKLGQQLLSNRSHINNLPLLLNILNPTSSSPPEFILEALLSVQSFFTPLVAELPSSSAKPTEDPESVYGVWLRSKFDEFVEFLIRLSVSTTLVEEALREVVVDTLMECVKVGNAGKFHSSIYHKFIHTMVYSIEEADTLLDLLVSKYFKYIDVCYFTYISLEKLIRTLDVRSASAESEKESPASASGELLIRNIHHVLSKIPPLQQLGEKSEFEMWNASGVFTKDSKTETKKKSKDSKTETNDVPSSAIISKKMKLKFSKAWMAFLTLEPLPIDVYKEVLVTLHQAVIPYLSNPKLLSDFLTKSYDIGGVISVMALSSLFILMTEHGFEYPNFYVKLYALLQPSIFIAKHRAKFFQLLDSCLKSPLLPAYLAASFAKKLSRLALTIPSSGSLVVIALIHNLLRRHPSINCLVHQEEKDQTAKNDISANPGIDHFKNEETDLMKTNALRSCLWEIDTLRHHYCPPLSRFVLSLENDLTVRSKTTEVAVKDFSSGSYATIFRDEMRRRVKQVPLAFYKAIPTSLFSESDFGGWTFQSEEQKQ
ncbi:putative nucleolar complex protein [Helianthus annuus]|uniref:Nucleolar complex protein n=2 Tax=Helianthus annuus TaxID=4232 RepID=A0A251RZD6_HELAN|nr:putative nucleolar complex protein [Helianthus annuus]KAJ0438437.1 putative nucleolar complex protein [Helianthus annuus]KAJ0443188.1 putative nucleolar complex protein [Helianthus annuus]KAJ0460761.1 putative nucleolar complex protein [Helianthus annuus]KAJ0645090.1 putative nucleolar complex protein [Helianthus annuus]